LHSYNVGMNKNPNDRRNFIALSAATALTSQLAWGGESAAVGGGRTVCVLGATGEVGNFIVQHALDAEFKVVAVSRSDEKLQQIAARYAATRRLATLRGDVSSDDQAADLRMRLTAAHGTPYAIVASLSSPAIDGPMRILDNPTDVLRKAFETNFFTHVTAARALIPALATGGTYVGINGGLANFPGAGMAQLTTTQSATHALYQVLALEVQDPKRPPDRRPFVRVLELYGLVDAGGAAHPPPKMRIDGGDLGRRVVEIISQPYPDRNPVLSLKSAAFS